MRKGRKSVPAERPARINVRNKVPSILGAGISVVGRLASDGEVQVDCEITGDILVSTVVIGPTGSVHGNIQAETVFIDGYVEGDVAATDATLTENARLKGDIAISGDLQVARGARVDGRIKQALDPDFVSELDVSGAQGEG